MGRSRPSQSPRQVRRGTGSATEGTDFSGKKRISDDDEGQQSQLTVRVMFSVEKLGVPLSVTVAEQRTSCFHLPFPPFPLAS